MLAGGVPVPGVIDVEVISNSYLAANRFRARFALSATGYAIWSAAQIQIEIRLGLDGAWASMILGPVDSVVVDPARGEVLVEGRDLTASLIAARTQETFENKTSSEIATTLALRHGLVPAVTPTTTLVGRNFQNDHSRITLDQHARSTTEWDLLIRLAEIEGFDVWVDGQVLNFAPLGAGASPVMLTPSDCVAMRLERSLPLTAGVSVAVKSWDCRGSQAIVQRAGGDGGETDGNASYIVLRPNMTAQAAQTLARRLLTQLGQQGRAVSIDMPGDLTMQPRDTLTLVETGTDFDGTYVITEVERRMCFDRGFEQSIEARLPPWISF